MTTKRTKGLRIATPCATVEQFIAAFHRFCEENSFFVSTLSLRPVGIETAFSVDLNSGQSVLRGFGVVLDAWSTAENRFGRPGVRIGVHELTTDTKAVFEQLLIARAVADSEPKPKRSPTRQIWAIKIPGVPALGTPPPTDLRALESAVPVTEELVPPTQRNPAPPEVFEPRVTRARTAATPPSIPIIKPRPTPLPIAAVAPAAPEPAAAPIVVAPIIAPEPAPIVAPPPVIAPEPAPPIITPPEPAPEPEPLAPPPIVAPIVPIVAREPVVEPSIVVEEHVAPPPLAVTPIGSAAIVYPSKRASHWKLALAIAGVFVVGAGVGGVVGFQVASSRELRDARPPVVMTVTAPTDASVATLASDAAPVALVSVDAMPVAVITVDAAPAVVAADAAPAIVVVEPPLPPVTKPHKPAKPTVRPHPKPPIKAPHAKCVGLSCI